MEYVTKTRLPLHSNGIIYPSSLLRSLRIGIIVHSYLLVPIGGEIIKPKAKGPHHHHFQNFRNERFN
jgi:hypothetical protein